MSHDDFTKMKCRLDFVQMDSENRYVPIWGEGGNGTGEGTGAG